VTHASAAGCSTGSWHQKWSCGWHQPTTAAQHAGFAFVHSAGWAVLAGVIIGLLWMTGRRSRARRRAPARR
jgi:hypothetical protein